MEENNKLKEIVNAKCRLTFEATIDIDVTYDINKNYSYEDIMEMARAKAVLANPNDYCFGDEIYQNLVNKSTLVVDKTTITTDEEFKKLLKKHNEQLDEDEDNDIEEDLLEDNVAGVGGM